MGIFTADFDSPIQGVYEGQNEKAKGIAEVLVFEKDKANVILSSSVDSFDGPPCILDIQPKITGRKILYKIKVTSTASLTNETVEQNNGAINTIKNTIVVPNYANLTLQQQSFLQGLNGASLGVIIKKYENIEIIQGKTDGHSYLVLGIIGVLKAKVTRNTSSAELYNISFESEEPSEYYFKKITTTPTISYVLGATETAVNSLIVNL